MQNFENHLKEALRLLLPAKENNDITQICDVLNYEVKIVLKKHSNDLLAFSFQED